MLMILIQLFRFEHLRPKHATNWELSGPSPRDQGDDFCAGVQCAAAFHVQHDVCVVASHVWHAALRDLPRPGFEKSAAGSLRHKSIAQVLPPYMIEHDEMLARQRRSKQEAAVRAASTAKRQRDQAAASKTRD